MRSCDSGNTGFELRFPRLFATMLSQHLLSRGFVRPASDTERLQTGFQGIGSAHYHSHSMPLAVEIRLASGRLKELCARLQSPVTASPTVEEEF